MADVLSTEVTNSSINNSHESLILKDTQITPKKFNDEGNITVATKLSHKKWRRHLKKMRRREERRDYARRRDDEDQAEQRKMDDEYYKVRSKVESRRKEEEERADEDRRKRDHDDWVQREKVAVDNINRKKQEDEDHHRRKEENENKIRSEWDQKERSESSRQDNKEEVFKKEMENLDRQQQHPPGFHNFHNPERPATEVSNQSFVPSQNLMDPSGIDMISLAMDPRNCKFYLKTGACRFGPKCSRNHLKFNNSTTVLIQNFFQDARLAIPMLNERSNDSGLEYDEVDLIHEFEKFYDDVIGEFRAAGTVIMFKCCQNFVPHLRGNVYVQFTKNSEALESIKMFNGRYYAGRRLTIELSPVSNWTSSICGLFDKRLCPRGKACNFLHVFRNPGNAYSVPNRTDFDPERAFRSGGYDPSFVNPNHPVFKYYNQRDAYGYRSEDAARSGGYGRNRWDNIRHSRSRSRDRDRKKRSRRSRSRSRGRSRSRSYSRSRSRSRSRRRRHSRSRTRSSSGSRSRTRSRSRSKDRKRNRKHSRSSNSSKDSKKRGSRNNSEVSDTSTDWSDLSED